jgi:hypothetical protein
MSILIAPADRTPGSLPEQVAGKGLQSRIEGIAMGHGVTASMEPMRQGDRQWVSSNSSGGWLLLTATAARSRQLLALLDFSGPDDLAAWLSAHA